MDLGAPELLIILLVVMLLFGAKKLPELARGSGRALRIFKQEVTGGHESSATGHDADTPGHDSGTAALGDDGRS